MKEIFVSRTLVGSDGTDTLHFNITDDYYSDDVIVIDKLSTIKSLTDSNFYPINIKDLKDYIEKFEKLGATHMVINYDEDHSEYLFDAYKLELASKEDIEEFESKEAEINRIRKEISQQNKIVFELQQKLHKLNK